MQRTAVTQENAERPSHLEETGEPTLEMSNISKRYGGVAALTDVSVQILPGEVHAILGENGAGKSTLMNIATGTTHPDGGIDVGAGHRSGLAEPEDGGLAGHRHRAPASGGAS